MASSLPLSPSIPLPLPSVRDLVNDVRAICQCPPIRADVPHPEAQNVCFLLTSALQTGFGDSLVFQMASFSSRRNHEATMDL